MVTHNAPRCDSPDVEERLTAVFANAIAHRGKTSCRYSDASSTRKAPLDKDAIRASHGLLAEARAIDARLCFKKTDLHNALEKTFDANQAAINIDVKFKTDWVDTLCRRLRNMFAKVHVSDAKAEKPVWAQELPWNIGTHVAAKTAAKKRTNKTVGEDFVKSTLLYIYVWGGVKVAQYPCVSA